MSADEEAIEQARAAGITVVRMPPHNGEDTFTWDKVRRIVFVHGDHPIPAAVDSAIRRHREQKSRAPS